MVSIGFEMPKRCIECLLYDPDDLTPSYDRRPMCRALLKIANEKFKASEIAYEETRLLFELDDTILERPKKCPLRDNETFEI